jgi:antitoxin ParD1/3/4
MIEEVVFMATISISIPDEMKALVEEQAAKCGFGTVSEYMRVLIRGVQERQAERECVDALLLAGLDSGPASPLTPVEWESIHQEVHKRHAARQERIHGSKDSEGCQASSGSSRYR